MSDKTSVTVVIPARNSAGTLGRALDSVLAQTRLPDEIIVVDDASTDGTATLARSYTSQGVHLLGLPERRGAAAARNAGIGAAKGIWIAFLDADDEWLPDKLERQVAAISLNPMASFVFCASEEFSPEGQSLGDTFRGWPITTGREAWKALLACNFVATPTVIAGRALLLQLGGFDDALKVAEDQDMWIRLALAGQATYVPESLVRVHMRPESLSTWELADQYTYTLPMIENHLAALSGRLTKFEARAIMGARLNKIGLMACAHGDLLPGLSMMLRSVFLGYRPLWSIGTMIKAPLSACLRKVRFGQRGRMAI